MIFAGPVFTPMQIYIGGLVYLTLLVAGVVSFSKAYKYLKVHYSEKSKAYSGLHWGPWEAVIGTLVIFVGGQFLAVMSIYASLTIFGWDSDRISLWLKGGGTAQFLLIITTSIISTGLVYAFLKSRQAALRELGIVKPKLQDVGYALSGLSMYAVLYYGVARILTQVFTSLDTEQKQDLGFSVDASAPLLALTFVALVIVPPLFEELIARGFLYSGLRKGLNFLPAAIITSLFFGMAHLFGGEGGSAIWIAVIDTFTLGMVLAYLRERTGSLWASIGLHATKNLIAFLALFVFKIV